jgi:hypothetical protein
MTHKRYHVTEVGSTVDLDTEEVRLADGRRLTNDVADELADEIRAKTGRPSLGEPGTRSPSIAFRLPTELRAKAEQVAQREGKSVSALAREALEARLNAS